ncbi:carbohydrate ABC transporter permease [Metabacillus halosaccharovorans]|uniref:carbohydrate ABC transporter permease n=1 Tax=Metabacillus halosaccharovorans TaxID=930124 RepID=UPI002040EF8B|nr:sugar ABC transporter permease [Metabacillus halosaccharovorans]MCM3443122.1 sugar ABC transporter permease [Metabacillus halosaccharovorans]
METVQKIRTTIARHNKEKSLSITMRKTLPYWFLMPGLVLFFIFFVLPFLFSLYLSFHEWNMIKDSPEFVGIQNYQTIFNSDVYWKSVKNTGLFVLFTVPLSLVIGLGLALLIESLSKGKVFYRMIFFLPVVSSIAIMGIVWSLMYNPQVGAVNVILRKLGIEGMNWLNDPKVALVSLAIVSVWNSFGYNVILFISGLKGIDKSLYESAALDGANKRQIFSHVTLPMLSPVTFFVFVMSVIASFQVFTTIQVMTKGGPNNTTNVLVYNIYQEAFQFFNMGTATASATVLFIVVVVLTIFQLVVGKKFVHYQ